MKRVKKKKEEKEKVLKGKTEARNCLKERRKKVETDKREETE